MQGVFTVQPAVEWLLCVIFLALYARRATHGKQAQSTRGNPLHAVGKLPARPFLPAEPVRAHSRPAAGAPREMHDAICANCGKPCKVPFRPREDRPVYCSECFAEMKEGH